MSRRGDEAEPEFRSYYGRPVLKPPVWKWDVPAYLFTGGAAAGASLIAAGADLTGRPGLRRSMRWASLGGIGVSTYFLVHDLGRPERFLNMLRLVKPTSPMSVGSWFLAAFGPSIGAAAASELSGLLPERGPLGRVRRFLPRFGRVGGLSAAVVAPHLATYTAVLLADTAVPAWHESHKALPFVFSGSALASGAGVALLFGPLDEMQPARRVAALGAGMELAATHVVENRLGLQSEAFHLPKPKRLLTAARWLTAGGVVGSFLGRRSSVLSAVSGLALCAGSVCTRFGIYSGGVESAKDPKYTVVPQRERVDRGEGIAQAARR